MVPGGYLAGNPFEYHEKIIKKRAAVFMPCKAQGGRHYRVWPHARICFHRALTPVKPGLSGFTLHRQPSLASHHPLPLASPIEVQQAQPLLLA